MTDRILPLPKDLEVLNFIKNFIEENGWSPIVVEICEGLGLSRKSVGAIARRIDNLEELGLIVRTKYTMRSLYPTEMLDELEHTTNRKEREHGV